MNDKKLTGIRQGWASRALATGRIAASAAQLAARRVVGVEGNKDGLLGLELAKELDQMKGMAMKVGQILSYFDGILPEETHKALQSLQRGAQPVVFESMAKVIEEAFGQPVDALFEAFEREPIASASIGQVYRARFEGQRVAVKVQYPQIRETIVSDFSRLGTIGRLASLATAVDGMAIVEELKARFAEECDYGLEAQNQALFASAFSDDPTVQIPTGIQARTRGTVLTTTWCEGQDFYTFVQNSTQEQRNEAARVLMHFAYRSIFELGMVNADPHPGNYLFPLAEPQTGPLHRPIIFLDFGCVRHFERPFLERERRLVQVVLNGQRDAFRDAVMATGMVPRPEKFSFDQHWDLMRYQYAPYLSSNFRFTTAYIQEGAKFSGPSNANSRHLAIPPQWIWLQRLQWGLHAVLARLGAEGDFGTVLRRSVG